MGRWNVAPISITMESLYRWGYKYVFISYYNQNVCIVLNCNECHNVCVFSLQDLTLHYWNIFINKSHIFYVKRHVFVTVSVDSWRWTSFDCTHFYRLYMTEMYGLYGVNQQLTINQLINQPLNQSINQSIGRSINQFITEIRILQYALKVILETIVPARANPQATVLCVVLLVTV